MIDDSYILYYFWPVASATAYTSFAKLAQFLMSKETYHDTQGFVHHWYIHLNEYGLNNASMGATSGHST